ncbi:choline transporter-like protein 4 [Nilaparvata lugens]|uniref:choline transporter-like protein 4 n=1 Tax=Nilaparvata lugens TaxID=108931 RepID=UPI00193EB913|nr:choline transporter-like protein 4 [Nilaparvata lugens]
MSPRVQQGHDHEHSLHHDPDFKGPRRNRSCTDIICLLFFIIAMVAWVIVGRYGEIFNFHYCTLKVNAN